MDDILDSNLWTAKEKEHLNYWRLFLQIETLADITDGLGTRLICSV
jgi:hypothetical protein